MADWVLLLVPLLALPIVLLFRFVGCGIDVVGTLELPAPKYPEYILADPAAPPIGPVKHREVRPNKNDVVAYWRLIDPESIHVTGDIQTKAPAKDERGFQNGIYVAQGTPFEQPTPAGASPSSPGSDYTQAGSASGGQSLLASEPLVTCRRFKGEHIEVPFKEGLYPDQFSIEVWVLPEFPNPLEFEHTLVTAGGHYRPDLDPSPSAAFHGFSIVADRTGHWQVRFPNIGDLFSNPPAATPTKTHLVVTVTSESGQSRVRLFVNAKEVLPPSDLVFYSPPKGARLLIGAASTLSDPKLPTVAHRPLNGLLQELAIYRKPLSLDEIENHFTIGNGIAVS